MFLVISSNMFFLVFLSRVFCNTPRSDTGSIIFIITLYHIHNILKHIQHTLTQYLLIHILQYISHSTKYNTTPIHFQHIKLKNEQYTIINCE